MSNYNFVSTLDGLNNINADGVNSDNISTDYLTVNIDSSVPLVTPYTSNTNQIASTAFVQSALNNINLSGYALLNPPLPQLFIGSTNTFNSVTNFNGAINNWVRSTTGSVGGTISSAAWTLRPNNYNYNTNNYRSNDNTQFYMSNSEAQAGTTTLTTLRSPVMNTVGYTNLSLDFFHYFNAASLDTAQVQVSLNNTTWTTVATYLNDVGGRTSFANQVINLNAYIGQPIFYVRFRYSATNDNYWAIDNVSLTGNCNKYFYDWVSAPAGFSSTSANPVKFSTSVVIVNLQNGFEPEIKTGSRIARAA
jgi:hypothetical protein